MQKRTAYGERIAIYLIGMLLLATGIILNTKTAMGVSPLVSIRTD